MASSTPYYSPLLQLPDQSATATGFRDAAAEDLQCRNNSFAQINNGFDADRFSKVAGEIEICTATSGVLMMRQQPIENFSLVFGEDEIKSWLDVEIDSKIKTVVDY